MENQRKLTQRMKLISSYALILLMSFSLMISSCKKKEATPPAIPDDVYIAGNFTDDGKAYPAYWKNGEKKPLGTSEGQVEAIAVNGANVYAVGYVSSKSGQIILWKNGNAIKVTLDAEPSAYAYAIAVSGTDVYVAGRQLETSTQKYFPKYWKIDTSTNPATVMSTPLGKGPPNNTESRANAIAVSANQVYISGYAYNGSNYIVVLWKGDGTYIPLTLGQYNAFSYGIAISGSDVYIGGSEAGTAKYWEYNGLSAATSHDIGTAGKSQAGEINCIAVNDSKVYMAWYDYSGTLGKAMHWNNGTKIPLSTGSAVNEETYSIAVAGNNVYVAGRFDADPAGGYNFRSILWKNGKKVAGFKGEEDILALALFVVKK